MREKKQRLIGLTYMLVGALVGVVFSGFLLVTCSHGGPLPVGVGASAIEIKPAGAQKKTAKGQSPPRSAFGRRCRESYAAIAEKVVPSVVNIHSTRVVSHRKGLNPLMKDPRFRRFFGNRNPFGKGGKRQMKGLGSGVIVSKDGYIVTNYHVVAKATDIRVGLADKRELKATVKGTDPRSDLALLKVEATDLTPAKLGSSKEMKVGDVVLALGNPFGVGETVTMGIVSAKGRAGMGITDYEDFIQTDAAINPGNSGGALVNLEGEVVGVPTAILSRTGGYQGIGFAIPADMVSPIITSLRNNGKVERGYLGVMIQKINPSMAKALGTKPGVGILVGEVQDGTPAKKAGLKSGDVIRKLNGKTVTSFHRFRNRIASMGAGTSVSLDVLRKNKRLKIQVELGALPIKGQAAASGKRSPSPGSPGDTFRGVEGTPMEGVKVGPLTATRRRALKVPSKRKGVLVEAVEAGKPAALAGLESGDVILSLNRKSTPTLKAFRGAVKKSRSRVFVRVWRGGRTLYLGWVTR